MHRDNTCVYMGHACFYGHCSDCVGVCRNSCCVDGIVKDGVLASELCVCVEDVIDIVFSV